MIRIAFALAMLVLAGSLAPSSVRADSGADASFQGELKSILARGLESKRGIVFHINGQEVAGVVKRILSDAVIVANQQNATVLIRLDRIEAVALD